MAKLRVDKIAASGQISENTGSVFFDGTDDYLIAPSSNDFSFAADFTIEFWVNTSTFSADSFFRRVVSSGADAATSIQLLFYDGSGATSNLSVYSNAMLITGNIAVATGDWVHVALSRSGTSMKLFVNGVQSGSTATTSQNFSGGATNGLIIGKYAGGNSGRLNGYLSNLRICKGHAVYTSNFAPPTRELEVHPETVLLCCYDGENIFADKSGRHIIAAYGDRLSSPTPTATDSPIGITTNNPGLIRSVDATNGPVLKGNFSSNSQNWLTLPKGTTTDRNRTGGRGLFMGGYTNIPSGTAVNIINYLTISTSGNAFNFGDLTNAARWAGGSCGSSTRGLYGGGAIPTSTDHIDFVTIATTSNAIDFGNLDTAQGYVKACSNATRGIWGGGRTAPTVTSNVIQYVTIATLGNAQEFGILTSARTGIAAVASPTRGIFSGGYTHPSPTALATIDYVTIVSTGNAIDFGDLLTAVKYSDAVSSGTRGVIGGGSPNTNVIQYVTISTLGDAQDFGDLIVAREHLSATDNSIRGVFAGGVTPTYQNTIDYITITSTGNAQDFGDLPGVKPAYAGGTSDSHGGLS